MTAPRQLLGWTVPEHVMSFDVAPDEQLTLWCFKHEPRVGSGRITRDGEHRPDQIIDFLKAHAHGVTVEYRPNLDPDVAWPLPGVLPETPEPAKPPKITPLTAPPPEPTAEDIHQAYLAVNATNVTFQPPFLGRVKDLVDDYRDEYGPPEWDVVAHLTLSVLKDIGWGRTDSLRAEVDRLNLEFQGYQTNDGYEKGWEHGSADADRLRRQLAEAVEMVKTCTGHPDRANPEIPSHAELIQQARAERGSDD